MDLKRRDHTHIEMWREDLAEQEETLTTAHLQQVAALAATIASLQHELDDRPTQVVHESVDQPILDQAWDERERAFRSRNRVLRDMTNLHLLHFEMDTGKCRCGKPADVCQERVILDSSRALKAWERRQHELRRRGEPHLLPKGHPGVVDARWDPDEELHDLYREFEDGPGY